MEQSLESGHYIQIRECRSRLPPFQLVIACVYPWLYQAVRDSLRMCWQCHWYGRKRTDFMFAMA